MKLDKFSPCKINLLLNILGKRPDGYHELETIMVPIQVQDRLSFESVNAGIELTCNNPILPTNSKNLVFRAASLFFEAAQIKQGVKIHLEKSVPIAAGLGGGSGNAAVTLSAMNELFGFPLEHGQLNALASSLGSDIPFFLQTSPALATGRGEKVKALQRFPAFRGAYVVLVHPGFGISTPWAYQQLANYPDALNGQPGRAEKLVSLLQKADLTEAGKEFYNSLEAPALHKYPLLSLYQKFFREHGALGTLMSGSGSATFAIAGSKTEAEAMRRDFHVEFGSKPWSAIAPL